MQRRRRRKPETYRLDGPGRPNLTDSWQAAAREVMEMSNPPILVEIGSRWIRQLAHTSLEAYRPTLGGYPLQREKLGAWRRSVDNIREISEQLGKPFWIEAAPAGILFHWKGTLGSTEDCLAMGFVIGVRHKACRALADICHELGHGEDQTANRRKLSSRKMRMFTGTLFHNRRIRTWNMPSQKRWVETEAVSA